MRGRTYDEATMELVVEDSGLVDTTEIAKFKINYCPKCGRKLPKARKTSYPKSLHKGGAVKYAAGD